MIGALISAKMLLNSVSRMPCACSSSERVKNMVKPVISAISRNPVCATACPPWDDDAKCGHSSRKLRHSRPLCPAAGSESLLLLLARLALRHRIGHHCTCSDHKIQKN